MKIITPPKKQRPCPDCGETLLRRSSKRLHPLLSRTLLICRNPICGATFAGIDEITHRLSPSGIPNTQVELPTATKNMQTEIFTALTTDEHPED